MTEPVKPLWARLVLWMSHMKTKTLVQFPGMKKMAVENNFSCSPFAGHSWTNLQRYFTVYHYWASVNLTHKPFYLPNKGYSTCCVHWQTHSSKGRRNVTRDFGPWKLSRFKSLRNTGKLLESGWPRGVLFLKKKCSVSVSFLSRVNFFDYEQ
jgi:hypothetical protein